MSRPKPNRILNRPFGSYNQLDGAQSLSRFACVPFCRARRFGAARVILICPARRAYRRLDTATGLMASLRMGQGGRRTAGPPFVLGWRPTDGQATLPRANSRSHLAPSALGGPARTGGGTTNVARSRRVACPACCGIDIGYFGLGPDRRRVAVGQAELCRRSDHDSCIQKRNRCSPRVRGLGTSRSHLGAAHS